MAKEKKQRKLTAAEARRLVNFDAVCADLRAKGYRQVNLIIDMKKATIAVIVAAVPLFMLYSLLFIRLNPDARIGMDLIEAALLLVVFFALIVAHELVHGLTWSFFLKGGMSSIEFGIMWNSLSPYCTCTKAIPRGPYLVGALMPLLLLGILPSVAAMLTGWFWLLALGYLMTLSAGGDVMIVAKLLAYRTDASEILWYDHPTEAGGVLFER